MNGKNQAHMMTLLYNAFPSLKGGLQEIVNMYRELGPVVAEDIFYRAYDKYWYSNYFTQGRSHQS